MNTLGQEARQKPAGMEKEEAKKKEEKSNKHVIPPLIFATTYQ
jgi:hypothetical protein